MQKISELIEYSYNLIHKRIHQAGGTCGVSKDEVRVLGWRAFSLVYSRGKGGGGRSVAASLLDKLIKRNQGGAGKVREEGGRVAWQNAELRDAAAAGLDLFALETFVF